MGSRKTAGKAGRPTMHDVAALAAVSQMTVSRVLRNEGHISQHVKERVEAAVAKLGYIHNRMASVQRGMENPMIGVVLPTLNSAVFVEVLAGINDTLSKHNMRPVFGVSEYSEVREEQLVRDMLSWQPCGLILSGTEHTEHLRRAIAQSDVRVAEIMDVDGNAMATAIGISHDKAGQVMAEHLLSKGYRRVAYLGSQGGADLRASKRFAAFQKRFEDGGGAVIHRDIADGPSSMLLGREMTERCLTEAVDPDAIYCSNDDLAAGGLMHCLSNGISVPNDIAIAGFNDLPFLKALPKRITTTRTPRYDMGVRAADFVAREQDAHPTLTELPTELVIGETT